MNFIINPQNNKKLNIFSKEAKLLLKKYVLQLTKGGYVQDKIKRKNLWLNNFFRFGFEFETCMNNQYNTSDQSVNLIELNPSADGANRYGNNDFTQLVEVGDHSIRCKDSDQRTEYIMEPKNDYYFSNGSDLIDKNSVVVKGAIDGESNLNYQNIYNLLEGWLNVFYKQFGEVSMLEAKSCGFSESVSRTGLVNYTLTFYDPSSSCGFHVHLSDPYIPYHSNYGKIYLLELNAIWRGINIEENLRLFIDRKFLRNNGYIHFLSMQNHARKMGFCRNHVNYMLLMEALPFTQYKENLENCFNGKDAQIINNKFLARASGKYFSLNSGSESWANNVSNENTVHVEFRGHDDIFKTMQHYWKQFNWINDVEKNFESSRDLYVIYLKSLLEYYNFIMTMAKNRAELYMFLKWYCFDDNQNPIRQLKPKKLSIIHKKAHRDYIWTLQYFYLFLLQRNISSVVDLYEVVIREKDSLNTFMGQKTIFTHKNLLVNRNFRIHIRNMINENYTTNLAFQTSDPRPPLVRPKDNSLLGVLNKSFVEDNKPYYYNLKLAYGLLPELKVMGILSPGQLRGLLSLNNISGINFIEEMIKRKSSRFLSNLNNYRIRLLSVLKGLPNDKYDVAQFVMSVLKYTDIEYYDERNTQPTKEEWNKNNYFFIKDYFQKRKIDFYSPLHDFYIRLQKIENLESQVEEKLIFYLIQAMENYFQ